MTCLLAFADVIRAATAAPADYYYYFRGAGTS
jgi:hypothetical protein